MEDMVGRGERGLAGGGRGTGAHRRAWLGYSNYRIVATLRGSFSPVWTPEVDNQRLTPVAGSVFSLRDTRRINKGLTQHRG